MIADKIKNLAEKYYKEVISVRRHLHQHPELSFEEHQTSDYIFNLLQKWGLQPERTATTGVTCLIKGKDTGKNIALRADIDALPINELNTHNFVSQNQGVMHACGHDIHTSSLLGVALILKELQHDFKGSIRLIFQPAEEKAPGGAQQIIKEGWLNKPKTNHIFGQHVDPEIPVGSLGFREGDYMASTDEINIRFVGKGGHAAMPWKLVDPVLMASHTLVALQQIVSRNAYPGIPTVLSFGKIESISGAINVIPNEVYVQGTFRTFNEEWRYQAHQRIKDIATQIAKSMGGNAEVEVVGGYPVLNNHAELTRLAKATAIEYLGKEKVIDLDRRMTGEDFAYYGQHTNATFYRLGVRNEEKNIVSALHSPTFDADEDALKTGMGFMSFLALKSL